MNFWNYHTIYTVLKKNSFNTIIRYLISTLKMYVESKMHLNTSQIINTTTYNSQYVQTDLRQSLVDCLQFILTWQIVIFILFFRLKQILLNVPVFWLILNKSRNIQDFSPCVWIAFWKERVHFFHITIYTVLLASVDWKWWLVVSHTHMDHFSKILSRSNTMLEHL